MGWRAKTQYWFGGVDSNCSDRDRRDRSYSCKDSQRLPTRTQDGACRVEPEKEQCSDVENDDDTRYGLEGLSAPSFFFFGERSKHWQLGDRVQDPDNSWKDPELGTTDERSSAS